MIYINFASITSFHRDAFDKRRPSALHFTTHGHSRSFYLLSSSDELNRLPEIFYIVPSEAIDTAKRRTLNEERIKHVQKNGWKGLPRRVHTQIHLSGDECIQVYRVARKEVENFFARIFREWIGADTYFVGDPVTSRGTTIQLSEYIQSKQSVLQEYLLAMDTSQDCWAHCSDDEEDSDG